MRAIATIAPFGITYLMAEADSEMCAWLAEHEHDLQVQLLLLYLSSNAAFNLELLLARRGIQVNIELADRERIPRDLRDVLNHSDLKPDPCNAWDETCDHLWYRLVQRAHATRRTRRREI